MLLPGSPELPQFSDELVAASTAGGLTQLAGQVYGGARGRGAGLRLQLGTGCAQRCVPAHFVAAGRFSCCCHPVDPLACTYRVWLAHAKAMLPPQREPPWGPYLLCPKPCVVCPPAPQTCSLWQADAQPGGRLPAGLYNCRPGPAHRRGQQGLPGCPEQPACLPASLPAWACLGVAWRAWAHPSLRAEPSCPAGLPPPCLFLPLSSFLCAFQRSLSDGRRGPGGS